MKFSTRTVLGIAILSVMLISAVSPAVAAAEWPIEAGDKLAYDYHSEETVAGNEAEEDDYSEVWDVSIEVEISEIDDDEVTFIITKCEIEATIEYGDEDVQKLMDDALDEQIDEYAGYVEDAEELTSVGDMLTIPFAGGVAMTTEALETYLEDWEDDYNEDDYAAMIEMSMEYGLGVTDPEATVTIEGDASDFTITVEVTGDLAGDDFELSGTISQKISDDGILQEYNSEMEMTAGDVSMTMIDTVKKAGLIPGYSVPIFLGLSAFTMMGVIALIKRRK